MIVDINVSTLNNIIDLMGRGVDLKNFNAPAKNSGFFGVPFEPPVQAVLKRLLRILGDKCDSEILGPSIVRELLYTIMKGAHAGPLYSLAMKNSNLARIDLVLNEIHEKFDRRMDIHNLARIANMSVSSFHQAFKDVTSFSPIQYLKTIRLSKARSYLIENAFKVNEAAAKVGYESPSQFNREFKRYFGVTPGSVQNRSTPKRKALPG